MKILLLRFSLSFFARWKNFNISGKKKRETINVPSSSAHRGHRHRETRACRWKTNPAWFGRTFFGSEEVKIRSRLRLFFLSLSGSLSILQVEFLLLLLLPFCVFSTRKRQALSSNVHSENELFFYYSRFFTGKEKCFLLSLSLPLSRPPRALFDESIERWRISSMQISGLWSYERDPGAGRASFPRKARFRTIFFWRREAALFLERKEEGFCSSLSQKP